MTISAQTVRASVAGTALDVTDATVTLDEGVAPYAVATFTVPFTLDTADLVDPRNDPRVGIILQQTFTGSDTLGDISDQFGGAVTIAQLSTLWSGLDLYQIGETLRQPWNATPYIQTQTRTLDLGIRSRSIDHAAGTISITATSDEARLTDYALLRDTPIMPDSYSVADAVRLVLRTAIPGAVLDTSGAIGTVEYEAAIWQPGQTAWSYLSPLTASQNLRLWCDEHRVWHLEHPEDVVTSYPVALKIETGFGDGTAITIDDSIDRDNGLWFDGCVITYKWTPFGGGSQEVAYDVAGDASSSKVMSLTLDTPYPGPGEAAARLAKVTQLGWVIQGTRVSDFLVSPAALVSVHIAASPPTNYVGQVSAVSWSLPGGEMTLRTRDLS